jgi:hypothetical protein
MPMAPRISLDTGAVVLDTKNPGDVVQWVRVTCSENALR